MLLHNHTQNLEEHPHHDVDNSYNDPDMDHLVNENSDPVSLGWSNLTDMRHQHGQCGNMLDMSYDSGYMSEEASKYAVNSDDDDDSAAQCSPVDKRYGCAT